MVECGGELAGDHKKGMFGHDLQRGKVLRAATNTTKLIRGSGWAARHLRRCYVR
jgi:hypothetical protein